MSQPEDERSERIRRAMPTPVIPQDMGRDNRTKAALALGVLGLVAGAVAWIAGIGPLALAGGACALLAGLASVAVEADKRRVDVENYRLNSEVDNLEAALISERQRAESAGAPANADSHSGSSSSTSNTLIDEATGLFTEQYFRVTLDARVAAARRNLRPVAVVLLDVVTGVSAGDPRPADPRSIAESIRSTLREADTPCRLDNGMYGLLLEDTPENGAVWTVERVRRRLINDLPGQTLWAGVACYPAHAFTAEEILDQAGHALEAAREWKQDRIEVAISEP